MRPQKIIISAFGPYKDKVEIDLEGSFGQNGVFLITGDTGAGKTTIFDAINYVLYGEASASKKEGLKIRDAKSFRSNYASATDETFVELFFEHKGKHYRIRKNQECLRQDKRNGINLVKKDADAEFECFETKEVVSGITSVSNKVSELIGLTKDQFSQTVMIAQGDFLKIVNSKTKERMDLFQKIFNTEIYAAIKDRVNEKRKERKTALDEVKRKINTCFSMVKLEANEPNSLLLQNLSCNEYNIQKFLDSLAKLLQFQKEKRDMQLKLKDEYENKKSLKDKEYVECKNINDSFARLNSLSLQEKELKEKKSEMDQLEKKSSAGKKTLVVKTFEDGYLSAVKNLKDNEAAKAALEKILEQLNKDLPQYKKTAEEAKTEFEKIDAINVRIASLEEAIPLLKKLTSDKNKLTTAQKKQTVASEKNNDALIAYTNGQVIYNRNQYGRIAEELVDGVKCPVCGSIHHPSPAQKTEESISEEQLKQLQEAHNIALASFNDSKTAFELAKQALDSTLQQLKEKNVDEKKDVTELKDEISALKAKVTEVRKLYDTATKALNAKKSDIITSESKLADNIKLHDNLVEEQISKLAEFRKSLIDNGFDDESKYQSAKITLDEINVIDAKVNKYKTDCSSVANSVKELQDKLKDKKEIDLSEITKQRDNFANLFDVSNKEYSRLFFNISENEKVNKELTKLAVKLDKADAEYSVADELYNNISGKGKDQKDKLSFDTYVQQYYFKQVVVAANRRLEVLTDRQYILRCPEDASGRGQVGLDLEVLDRYTGMWRDVSSLSGGESFKTALSLALGLADVVQAQSGGIRLDAIFIDEGFGSLDEESLNQALKVLSDLSEEGNKLVGIISHVAELKQRIENKILVHKTITGSTLSIETA